MDEMEKMLKEINVEETLKEIDENIAFEELDKQFACSLEELIEEWVRNLEELNNLCNDTFDID